MPETVLNSVLIPINPVKYMMVLCHFSNKETGSERFECLPNIAQLAGTPTQVWRGALSYI